MNEQVHHARCIKLIILPYLNVQHEPAGGSVTISYNHWTWVNYLYTRPPPSCASTSAYVFIYLSHDYFFCMMRPRMLVDVVMSKARTLKRVGSS